ncbi:MAG TPA: glutamine amidotransferase [Vicinamibacterales bacterium]|nr:glutamine amidotransferase [Vicinamibacterales bacterium]
MENVFRFFFKYPPLMFQQGDVAWGFSRAMIVACAVGAAVIVLALATYRGLAAADKLRDRIVLVGLRLAALAVLLVCLFRPTLILKAAVPQQNFLAVLVDDSRSMAIADTNAQPRSAFITQQLNGPNAALLNALSKRFVVRFFKFASTSDRIQSTSELKYNGTATRLGQALDRARDELSGLPLAGVVMVTDGADTTDAAIDEPLASLKQRSIPVFTVGVGQEKFAKDVQVTRVETPRSVLKGTSLVVDVVLSQTGYAGQTVPLTVEDSGRIVSTQSVKLPSNGEAATVKVRFTANEAGPRTFSFKVPTQDGEQVTQNNARDALIQVNDRVEKILYYEGEPRFEYKFIRRAIGEDSALKLAEDKNIQVVGLARTAENKYYRQGVSNPDEVIGGFPKTREELFQYRALILGSVEAASFSPEQLRMIADFVSKRGGALLMLGGRRSFAEGGWAGTPVGDVLPVVMGNPNAKYLATDISIHPTRAGAIFPVTQIADTEDASQKKWDDMPELSAVNQIKDVKPGATVLLTGTDKTKQDHVILAYQRYGRGKALAMPVQDIWYWRMAAKTAVTDTTHAMFWRRMMRWLVDGVPDQVNVTTTADRVEPGEPIKIAAEVLDNAYAEVNDARVVAHITAPSGKAIDLPIDWTVTRDGDYRAQYVPDETGIYDIKVTAEHTATNAGHLKQLLTGLIHVRVSAGDAEYYDAAMRAPLLKRIAEETGGRFFTASNVASLPDAISYSGRGVTVVEERELWDMPVLFLLLVSLVCAEWGYRRVRGLA